MFLFIRPQTDNLSYNVKINDFDVELCLNPESSKIESTTTSPNVYWHTSKVRVSSARNEYVIPPTSKMHSPKMHSYYEEREPDYRQAALDAMNRAILFFKYRLHNPNLSTLTEDSLDFQNPVWIVESGEKFSLKICFKSLMWPPKKLGALHLSCQDDPDLKKALQCPIHPELSEELLSDAQSAIFHGDFRRAVLEMAIACETAVKQAFFSKTTPAGAAYEYFEDKGWVHVTIIELISSVAKQAFGKSFKEDEVHHYDNIDYLFRCRNKVAHRGELKYKDKSGILCSIGNDVTLTGWWESVEILRAWLQAAKAEE